MLLSHATLEDDPELKRFFASQVVRGLYSYRMTRPKSFFDQYKLTTDDFYTFVLKDQSSQIHAMASVLFKKAYVNDQEQTVGYLTDLRVSSSRKATLIWAKEFVPAFEQVRDERQCQFLFSDLELFESKAYNLLLRRRQPDHRLPRYHLFRKFNLVAIYGRFLFADQPLSSIQIGHGLESDIEEICQYLKEKSVRRPLRYNLTPEILKNRIDSWPNFNIENFLLARDRNQKLIGCMAPWDNSSVQQIVVEKYHGKSFQYYSTSRTLALMGMARPLPAPGQAFRPKHITHSACDNPDIFYSLLSYAYDHCRHKELLIYPNYQGEFATRPPRSFMSIKVPYGFYSVLDTHKRLPPYLHPNPFNPAPDFQFAYF